MYTAAINVEESKCSLLQFVLDIPLNCPNFITQVATEILLGALKCSN